MTDRQKQTADRLFAKAKQNRKSTSRSFFLFDLYERIRVTSLYVQWTHLLAVMRRFRAVTLTVRVFSFLFATLQAGTLVLLSATILLLVLPLLLVCALCVLLSAALASHRTNRMLSKRLTDRRVYVMFPTTLDNRFLALHVKDLCDRGYSVILVSPHLFSTTGILRTGFYITMREEDDHVFLVRRYYYFSLKRRLLVHHNTVYHF